MGKTEKFVKKRRLIKISPLKNKGKTGKKCEIGQF